MLNENVHIMLSQNTIRIFVLDVGDTHGQTLIQLKCLITPLPTRLFSKSYLGWTRSSVMLRLNLLELLL